MAELADVMTQLETYQTQYRRPGLGELAVGDLYDLFPEKATNKDRCKVQWPLTWPNSDGAGVYLFFDEDLHLLYVGKAAVLGTRLAAYCAYDHDKKCRLKHTAWSTKPRFVLTLAVPSAMSWEAAGLEEYLIQTLYPSDNVIGLTRTSSFA